MTLKDCYKAIEGDYEGVISRLMTEKLVSKFVLKFLNDTSFESLKNNLKENNIDEAFRAAHTLKGVCQNLGFTKLHESAHDITEALRGGNMELAESLFPIVEEAYVKTIEAIKSLE